MSPWRLSLEAPRSDPNSSMNRFAVTHRLVIRVDGVAHEVIKLDGITASVTLACEPTLGLLVDPDTLVYEHGEIDVDCMTCLVRRAWV